ncbi:MAG: S41 family peptidase [Bdellovibrionales bacterium]
MKKSARGLLVFSLLSIIAVAGILLGAMTSKTVLAVAEDRYDKLQNFSKVLNLIQQYYVEDTNVEKLIRGAIKGMLGELDPHTNYMPKEMFSDFENETSGEFGGLGIEISVQNEVLTIISPIEDTPAWKAGIEAGDRVVSIDGESTKGMTLADAARLIKGKIGEKIDLGIFRDGFEKPKVFTIIRGKIKIRSVKYTDLEDGYAYVRITSFIEKTGSDLKRVMDRHLKKYPDTKGVILDLRNNPGGLLTQAIKMSNLFLEEGVIVSTIGRNEKDKEVQYATKEDTYPNFPIIVLMNEYSASASEILAGALQDNKRALILGQRSFGKGSVQSVIKLGDGSGLKLTVARYFTPSGRSIQASGIDPDVSVENVNPEAFEKAIVTKNIRRESDIKGHLKNSKKKKGRLEVGGLSWYKHIRSKKEKDLSKRDKILSKDFQALQAYNYLKAWKVFNRISR